MPGTINDGNRARPIAAAERRRFEQDGYLIIRMALTPEEVRLYATALDRVYRAALAADRLQGGTSLHQVSAVAACPEAVGLIDHPATFRYVWSLLGWNIHVYHSYLDIHPPLSVEQPFRFEWHQDGGRQNREIETEPRPRMSVKLAYCLSDMSETGRGNLKILPGSHLANWIPMPWRRDMPWPDPEGMVEVTASPGDVVLLDRRIWRSQSDNYSVHTRKVVAFDYTYRWAAIRDDNLSLWTGDRATQLSPVRRQLLGGLADAGGNDAWGDYPSATPLYRWLGERDLLDPANPPLKP